MNILLSYYYLTAVFHILCDFDFMFVSFVLVYFPLCLV